MVKAHHKPDFGIRVFHSIRDCTSVWKTLAPDENIFLQYDYLELVEKYPPEGITFRYALVSKDDLPIGIVYTQIIYFNGAESIRYHRQTESARCFFQTFGQNLKGLVARQVEFNTLVCGNLMLSGEHGFYFKENCTDKSFLLEKTLRAIRRDLETSGTIVSVTLLKDFHEQAEVLRSGFQPKGYHAFHILPSMVMPLDPSWETYDDYNKSLSSKYRVRANKARKILSSALTRHILSPEEIEGYKYKIFELYQQVVDDSGFNVITIHPDYFPALAQQLGNKVQITGYFLEDELVGFMSAILNTNGELEAHFLGYDSKHNPPFKLYLNMLLDLVETGIHNRCQKVVFSRTAEEIKSSVGAKPVNLLCFIRHRSNFSNRFIKPLLEYLTPEEEIILRHPFRKQEETDAIQHVQFSDRII